MKRFFTIALIGATAAVGSVAAAGEIDIHNNTSEEIRVKCTYVRSFEVHHGTSQKVSYKSNVHDVSCQAHDHDNRHIESRDFHFEHQDSHMSWNVGRH